MCDIDVNELSIDEMGCAIPLKMTLDEKLEFIEGSASSIPLDLAADHGKLLHLGAWSISVWVLKSVAVSSVSGWTAMRMGASMSLKGRRV